MTTALADAQRSERLNPATVIGKGSSAPLGAILSGDGVNFSVYSSHAIGVELLLFDHVDDAGAARIIRIDPAHNRTYHYSHVRHFKLQARIFLACPPSCSAQPPLGKAGGTIMKRRLIML